MRGTVGWVCDTPELFSASSGEIGTGSKRFLVVEALPEGGWDWLAWANDASQRCMHGTAADRAAAMDAAEDAALLLMLAPPVVERLRPVLN